MKFQNFRNIHFNIRISRHREGRLGILICNSDSRIPKKMKCMQLPFTLNTNKIMNLIIIYLPWSEIYLPSAIRCPRWSGTYDAYQWRIQDFPEEGAPTPGGGTNTRFCQIFPKTA